MRIPFLRRTLTTPGYELQEVSCAKCGAQGRIPRRMASAGPILCPRCTALARSARVQLGAVPIPTAPPNRTRRVLLRKTRESRRRLEEAKLVLEQLERTGQSVEAWKAELSTRWRLWDEAEQSRINRDLVDSLRPIYPDATDPELEELAEQLGRKTT